MATNTKKTRMLERVTKLDEFQAMIQSEPRTKQPSVIQEELSGLLKKLMIEFGDDPVIQKKLYRIKRTLDIELGDTK
jgi:hypothetical protein